MLTCIDVKFIFDIVRLGLSSSAKRFADFCTIKFRDQL